MLMRRWESVAPYAGAWIEMGISLTTVRRTGVAPYAGAWIEMLCIGADRKHCGVAPYAGAWIEICCIAKSVMMKYGRSLRGSVD